MQSYAQVNTSPEDFDDLNIGSRFSITKKMDPKEFMQSLDNEEKQRYLDLKVKLRNGTYGNVISTKDNLHYYCNVCEIQTTNFFDMKNHINGKKHRSKVLLLSEPKLKAPKEEIEEADEYFPKLAPGEPVPPGFEDKVRCVTQIQSELDEVKSKPLIGLEFLLELTDELGNSDPKYVCLLCEKKGEHHVVFNHLTSFEHYNKYIGMYFPTASKAITTEFPANKAGKKAAFIVLTNICSAIEAKYGRLKPMAVDKQTFEAKKNKYLALIIEDRHFRETPGETFVELVDKNLLNASEPKSNDVHVPRDDKLKEDNLSIYNKGKNTLNQGREKTQNTSNIHEKASYLSHDNSSTEKHTKESDATPRRPDTSYLGPDLREEKTSVEEKEKDALSSISSTSISRSRSRSGSRSKRKSKWRSRSKSMSRRKSRERSTSKSRSKRRLRERSYSPPKTMKSVYKPHQRDSKTDMSKGFHKQSDKRHYPYQSSYSRYHWKRPSRSRSRSRSLPRKRSRSKSPIRSYRSRRSTSRSPPSKKISPKDERQVKVNEKIIKGDTDMKDKWYTFRHEFDKIEHEAAKLLKFHEHNPEKHPLYPDEWKKFWSMRYKELQAEGKDPTTYDFKPEWIEYWNKRMLFLHKEDVKNKKNDLKIKLGLPVEELESHPPVNKKTPLGLAKNVFVKQSKSPEIIKTNSPGLKEKPINESPVNQLPVKQSLVNEIPVREIKVRNPQSKEKVRERQVIEIQIKDSPERESLSRTNLTKEHSRTSLTKEPSTKVSLTKEPSTRESLTKEPSTRASLTKEPSTRASLTKEPSTRASLTKEPSTRASLTKEPSTRASLTKEPSTRVSLTKESPQESPTRESPTRESPTREIKIIRGRSIRGKPINKKEETRKVVETDEKENEEIEATLKHSRVKKSKVIKESREADIVPILRLLTAMESQLGSLGPKVNNLMGKALSLEKIKAHSADSLLSIPENIVLFETVKEKLKGQLIAGIVEKNMLSATKTCLDMLENTLEKAEKKMYSSVAVANPPDDIIKSVVENVSLVPEIQPITVAPVNVAPIGVAPKVDPLDKLAISQQIAAALIAEGKTDVTEEELEQLISAVTAMAQAAKGSGSVISTAQFVALQQQQQHQVGMEPAAKSSTTPLQQLLTVVTSKMSSPFAGATTVTPKSNVSGLQLLQTAYDEPKISPVAHTLGKGENQHNFSPHGTRKHSSTANENTAGNEISYLSEVELQTLLQNFKDLSAHEQQCLITYLRKLEETEPERVEQLRKYVVLEAPVKKSPLTATSKSAVSSPDRKESRKQNDGKEIEDKSKIDDSDDDYTYEEIYAAASRKVKESEEAKAKEREKGIMEGKHSETTATKSEDPAALLKQTKAMITNLMGQFPAKYSQRQLTELPSPRRDIPASQSRISTPNSVTSSSHHISGSSSSVQPSHHLINSDLSSNVPPQHHFPTNQQSDYPVPYGSTQGTNVSSSVQYPNEYTNSYDNTYYQTQAGEQYQGGYNNFQGYNLPGQNSFQHDEYNRNNYGQNSFQEQSSGYYQSQTRGYY